MGNINVNWNPIQATGTPKAGAVPKYNNSGQLLAISPDIIDESNLVANTGWVGEKIRRDIFDVFVDNVFEMDKTITEINAYPNKIAIVNNRICLFGLRNGSEGIYIRALCYSADTGNLISTNNSITTVSNTGSSIKECVVSGNNVLLSVANAIYVYDAVKGAFGSTLHIGSVNEISLVDSTDGSDIKFCTYTSGSNMRLTALKNCSTQPSIANSIDCEIGRVYSSSSRKVIDYSPNLYHEIYVSYSDHIKVFKCDDETCHFIEGPIINHSDGIKGSNIINIDVIEAHNYLYVTNTKIIDCIDISTKKSIRTISFDEYIVRVDTDSDGDIIITTIVGEPSRPDSIKIYKYNKSLDYLRFSYEFKNDNFMYSAYISKYYTGICTNDDGIVSVIYATRDGILKKYDMYTDIPTSLNMINDITTKSVNDINGRVSAIVEMIDIMNSVMATKTHVDDRFNELVGAAPEALDTLAELAKALDNDEEFSAKVIESLTTLRQDIGSIWESLNLHFADKENPHGVTREQIGAAAKAIYSQYTLRATLWSEVVAGRSNYVLNSIYDSNLYDIEISLNGSLATLEQKYAYDDAEIVGCFNANMITSYGLVPTIDIPIIIKAVRK